MFLATLLYLALLPMLKGQMPHNFTSNLSSVSFPPNSSSSQEVAVATHAGREHMVAEEKPSKINAVEIVKPVHEEALLQEVQQDRQKPVVPKKGVSFSDQPSNSSMTNGTVAHKKPLVTVADTDYLSKEDSKESQLAVDEIDPYLLTSKSTRSKYIIPIVAVILSVPLVAILLSVLYKRGTDWWQHRNYKRMDFLIEGIYQN